MEENSVADQVQSPENLEEQYPSITDRVKAVFIDSFLIIIAMYGVSDLFSMFEHVPDGLRMTSFILILGLYDPISISSFGATIGHNAVGIRVKREKDVTKNISFLSALIRYIVKLLLGWISFLTVGSSSKKKAIHDSAVNSVVVFKK